MCLHNNILIYYRLILLPYLFFYINLSGLRKDLSNANAKIAGKTYFSIQDTEFVYYAMYS